MPRAERVTSIDITGYVYISRGLDLSATGGEYSPYNPPIRYLSYEHSDQLLEDNHAELVFVRPLSSQISSFRFSVTHPVQILPGQYAILGTSVYF